MVKILGLCGSLRAQSFNLSLLRAAAGLSVTGTEIQIATLHGIPLYDGDQEQREGLPAAVITLKEQIVTADGLLLVTPEYNNGVPGVFKNGIDWLSRPAADIPRVFGNRPVAVMGASPGGFGTILSQNAWLPVLKALGTRPWFGGRLLVSRAQVVFDPTGQLVDESVRTQLQTFLQGFSEFVRQQRGAEFAHMSPVTRGDGSQKST